MSIGPMDPTGYDVSFESKATIIDTGNTPSCLLQMVCCP